jgi:hypothetical protein
VARNNKFNKTITDCLLGVKEVRQAQDVSHARLSTARLVNFFTQHPKKSRSSPNALEENSREARANGRQSCLSRSLSMNLKPVNLEAELFCSNNSRRQAVDCKLLVRARARARACRRACARPRALRKKRVPLKRCPLIVKGRRKGATLRERSREESDHMQKRSVEK